jgi:hypothetical protein
MREAVMLKITIETDSGVASSVTLPSAAVAMTQTPIAAAGSPADAGAAGDGGAADAGRAPGDGGATMAAATMTAATMTMAGVPVELATAAAAIGAESAGPAPTID